MPPEPESDLRCARVRLLLSLAIDGATTPAQDRELADHLPSCAGCRAAEAADRAVRARCSEPAAVPAGFAERIAGSALRQRLEARAQNRFLLATAAAAVLVAGVALLTFSSRDHLPDASTSPGAPREMAGRALRAGLALHRSPLISENR